MSTFYTKEQIDELANYIAGNLKNIVTPDRVITALTQTADYSLLTQVQKNELDYLIENSMRPAENTDSFVEALTRDLSGPAFGLAADYPGTGWYKATDTGTIFCKDVPEYDTCTYDNKEYVSVYTTDDAKLYLGSAATSNITNTSFLFNSFDFTDKDSDLSTWDMSNVTVASSMFASSNFNSPIGNWNVSKIVDMTSMFYYATVFNQDISNWNVQYVESMVRMFNSASSFNQDLSNWRPVNIFEEPQLFDDFAYAWVLPRPTWTQVQSA